jgi:hypothetical protein
MRKDIIEFLSDNFDLTVDDGDYDSNDNYVPKLRLREFDDLVSNLKEKIKEFDQKKDELIKMIEDISDLTVINMENSSLQNIQFKIKGHLLFIMKKNNNYFNSCSFFFNSCSLFSNNK